MAWLAEVQALLEGMMRPVMPKNRLMFTAPV